MKQWKETAVSVLAEPGVRGSSNIKLRPPLPPFGPRISCWFTTGHKKQNILTLGLTHKYEDITANFHKDAKIRARGRGVWGGGTQPSHTS